MSTMAAAGVDTEGRGRGGYAPFDTLRTSLIKCW
jgi:hypothetical protein